MRLRLCSPLCSVCVALLLVACIAASAAAQCGRWISGGGVSGLTRVSGAATTPTAVEIPGDGTPSSPSRLLVGGAFTSAGDIYANNRAYWDGVRWTPFGATNNHWIYNMAHFDGSVFAIALSSVPGQFSTKHIQRWDGNTIAASWEIYTVDANFQIVGNDLYVIGATVLGGVTPANLARWNGSGWAAVPATLSPGGTILATASYNGELIVAGRFTSINGVSASNIAMWNGTRWSPIGLGVVGDVNALTVVNGALVAGGKITSGDGVPATRITRWDGDGWLPMGQGLDKEVLTLGAWDNTVVAATYFNGGTTQPSYSRLYKWSANAWVPLTGDFAGFVTELMPFQGRLVALGNFVQIGGAFAPYIAVFDGNAWSPTHPGRTGDVRRGIIPMGDELAFIEGPGRVSAWNGRRWRTLGTADGPVNAYFHCMKLWNGDLVVGGLFDRISGVSVANIARKTPTGWEPIGSLPGPVVALATDGGELYAATGKIFTFDAEIAKVWRWNGTAWVHLPGNYACCSVVIDLAVWNGVLYGAGNRPTGSEAAPLMRWTGSAWTPFSFRDNSIANVLYPTTDTLYVGANSSASSGMNGVCTFNGTTAATMGGGYLNRGVNDIIRHQGSWVCSASGLVRQHSAGWTLLGNTTLASKAVGALGSEIILGGDFLTVGTMGSPYMARWTDTGIPWIVDQPQSQNRNIGDDLELSAAPALGYEFSGPLTYQWLRDGVPIANGPGGASASGGSVSGASGTLTGEEVATLRIANAAASDSGTFTVTIANSCGGTTSAPALLHVSCRADFNGIGGVTIDDLFLYINAYFSGAPGADFNGVGGVTIDDLFLYINAYFVGC